MVETMKKLEVVINPENFGIIRDCFEKMSLNEYDIYELLSHVSSENNLRHYRGAEYTKDFVVKIKIEAVVEKKKK